MSWFNFSTKKPRKIDVKFERELWDYYYHIKNITGRVEAAAFPPDVDEEKEFKKELKKHLKEHPEDADFVRLGRVETSQPSGLYIDPMNPPTKITKPKNTGERRKRREYTETEMISIYKLNNPIEKERLTALENRKVKNL